VGNLLKLESRALGAVLLCAAVGAGAMTLGRVRGTALIGQPLDLSIQVQFDGEENASSLCMEADVFHADTRQDPARVKVSVGTTQQPQMATVRVESSQPVDEPMVTVYLKAGCGQKITRRYVLLADFPSDPASGPIASAPVVAGSAPAQVSATTAVETKIGSTWAEASRSAEPAPRAPQNVVAKPPVVRKVKPPAAAPVKAVAAPAEKAATVEKQQAGRAAGQSRLRLDPLEVLAERVTTLEAAKAASAPASVPADDIVKDAMRFQSLEGDVKALLSLAAKNEASLLEMKTRLQKAESERFANWLVYALMVAILLCLAAIWTLWSRQRTLESTKGDWWKGGGDAGADRAGSIQSGVAPALRPEASGETPNVLDRNILAAGVPAIPPAKTHNPVSSVDLHLSEISASTFDTLLQSGPAPIRGSKPGALIGASGPGERRVSPDELFDIRQQAEFFVSLGQTDQAIRVLENHIAENAGSSPVLYLDLLQLFHSLNLKTDFRQYREDFNLLFNSRIPEFALFKQEGRGLEAYPDVLADISVLWSSPQVLQILEACIFHNSWDDKGQAFDLAAFRELLLLYGIALSEHEGSVRVGSSGQSDFARMPSASQGVRSGFGGLHADTFAPTRQSAGKTSQDAKGDRYPVRSEPLPSIYADVDLDLDTSLDSYQTRSEPLPSIYPDVDVNLDLDPDAINNTRPPKNPKP
jgi:pilus assembly protein FimV